MGAADLLRCCVRFGGYGAEAEARAYAAERSRVAGVVDLHVERTRIVGENYYWVVDREAFWAKRGKDGTAVLGSWKRGKEVGR